MNMMDHAATIYGLCLDSALHWLTTWQTPTIVHVSVRKDGRTEGWIQAELEKQGLLRGIDPLPFAVTFTEFPNAWLLSFRPRVEVEEAAVTHG